MSLCGRLVAAVACVLLGACGGTASTDTVVTDDMAEVRELIADGSFGAGVALSPLSVETVTSGGGFPRRMSILFTSEGVKARRHGRCASGGADTIWAGRLP